MQRTRSLQRERPYEHHQDGARWPGTECGDASADAVTSILKRELDAARRGLQTSHMATWSPNSEKDGRTTGRATQVVVLLFEGRVTELEPQRSARCPLSSGAEDPRSKKLRHAR